MTKKKTKMNWILCKDNKDNKVNPNDPFYHSNFLAISWGQDIKVEVL